MDEFLLDGCLRQVLRDDRRFEGLVGPWIFQRFYDRLGRQPMAKGIPARGVFSVGARWAGTLERVAAVCLDLLERGHARRGAASNGLGAVAFRARRPPGGFAGPTTVGPAALG